MTDILDRLESVRAKIVAAAQAASRDPARVDLVAVSKTQGAPAVREAFEAGQSVFGENRAQELVAKAPLLPSRVRWHFIGHLQRNKIRKILPLVEVIHSVDSMELALDIDRIAAELGLFPRVLLEVNVTGESSKFGFEPETLREQIRRLLKLRRLHVEGLMTIAPLAERSDDARPFFVRLRGLRDELAAGSGAPLPTLSMGMSGDFETAVQEGATIVRVGTAIFGPRTNP